MGIMKELKNSSRQKQRPAIQAKTRKGGFVTFHPSTAEKTQLREMPPSLEHALSRLQGKLEEGCGITVTMNQNNGSFAALIYDKSQSFDERITISCWHTQLDKAIVGLAFALDARWPDFPSEKPALGFEALEEDW